MSAPRSVLIDRGWREEELADCLESFLKGMYGL